MSQKRKLEDPNEAFCQTPPKKSRTQYSLDFKLNVLDNAKSFSSNIFEDWKKSPSFLEVALYVKPHSLLSRSKKLKNFIEAAAYQRSFTVHRLT